jgi:hypothetical protein
MAYTAKAGVGIGMVWFSDDHPALSVSCVTSPVTPRLCCLCHKLSTEVRDEPGQRRIQICRLLFHAAMKRN